MTAASPSRQKLQMLQGLRALAATMVVVDHAVLNLISRDILPVEWSPVAWRFGSAGVAMFFVISGFIMARTTERDANTNTALGFILRRLWRIAPLYWLATGIYAVRLIAGGEPPSAMDMARSLLFIPYFDGQGVFHPVLGPGWTLNFEMYFYLIFALSLLLPRMAGLVGIFVCMGGSVALGALAGAPIETNPMLSLVTDPIILFFLVGIGIHLVLHRVRGFEPSARVMASIATISLAALCIAVFDPFGLGPGFDIVMLPIAGALVAVAVLWRPSSDGWLTRWLVTLGDASYSLYLSHSFVLGPLATLYLAAGFGTSFWMGFVLLATLVCNVIGLLCYRFVEVPLLAATRPLFRLSR